MILDKVFERFARYSPVTVMMRGILEYGFPAGRIDELFREHAVDQYEDELLFSTVVNTLALAVNGVRKSVNAAYLASQEDFTVSVTAFYDKLQGAEPQVARAIVRESHTRLAPVIKALRAELPPLLPGYTAKILDGNHLTGTEHRLPETRTLNSSPLPGQALVVLDPQLRLITDVIPCEDAYAQERSLLGEVLPSFQSGDLAIADRNFCCTRFVFGLRDRQAAFLIRQHASTLSSRIRGRRIRGRESLIDTTEQKGSWVLNKSKTPDPLFPLDRDGSTRNIGGLLHPQLHNSPLRSRSVIPHAELITNKGMRLQDTSSREVATTSYLFLVACPSSPPPLIRNGASRSHCCPRGATSIGPARTCRRDVSE